MAEQNIPTDVLTERDAAMDAMETAAAEIFAQRDAALVSETLAAPPRGQRQNVGATPPPSDAPSRSPTTRAQPAALVAAPASGPAKAASPTSAAPAASKVAGAPTTGSAPGLVPPAAAGGSEVANAASAPGPDFSDIPDANAFAAKAVKPDNWKRLHAKADHYIAEAQSARREAESLRTQLAGAAAGAPPPELQQRLTTLQQERDFLQARLEAVAVERSPRFEAAYKPRQEAAIAQAKQAVGPALASKVESLLAMPESSYRDEQLEAVMGEISSPLRATKLTQAVADLDRLAAERQQAAARSGDLYKSWSAEEAAARDARLAQQRTAASQTFDTELRDWQPLGLSADEIASARAVYSGDGTSLQDAARAAMWAVAGPRMHQTAQAATKRAAELEAELSRLRSVQPGTARDNGGAAPPASSEDDDDPAHTGMADRIIRQAMREGVRFGGGR